MAATVPIVINALRDYRPPQAQRARNGSDDVFDVARLATPIAIGALSLLRINPLTAVTRSRIPEMRDPPRLTSQRFDR